MYLTQVTTSKSVHLEKTCHDIKYPHVDLEHCEQVKS